MREPSRVQEILNLKAAGICTDCQLENIDTTRFDGMLCKGCADVAEMEIR